jgi:ankyrin repeat protein
MQLLEHGADINGRCPNLETPLWLAAEGSDVSLVA